MCRRTMDSKATISQTFASPLRLDNPRLRRQRIAVDP